MQHYKKDFISISVVKTENENARMRCGYLFVPARTPNIHGSPITGIINIIAFKEAFTCVISMSATVLTLFVL